MIFTGDWSMPVKEAEATNSLADQGIDVVTCHVDGPKVVVETADRRGIYRLRLSRQPVEARAEGLPHRRGMELGHGLHDVRDEDADGQAAAELRARRHRRGFRASMSPYGPAVSEAARKHADATLAEIMKGNFSVIKGPLKDNKGATVVAAGTAYPETGDPARVDELSGGGRDRLHLVTTLTDIRAARAGQPAAAPSDRFYPVRRTLEAFAAPLFALALAAAVFSVFLLALGKSPADFMFLVWKGAFGSLVFAAEHAAARGAAAADGALRRDPGAARPGHHRRRGRAGAGRACGDGHGAAAERALAAARAARDGAGGRGGGRRCWIAITGCLRARRGVNETVASLVMSYIGIALFNHLVEGPLRDPASLNKPSTWGIGDANMIGAAARHGPASRPRRRRGRLHRGWVLIYRTVLGLRRARHRRQPARGAAAGPAGRRG